MRITAIITLAVFLLGCSTNCDEQVESFKNEPSTKITRNIDCDPSIGTEEVFYNYAGTIVELKQHFPLNDSSITKSFFDDGVTKQISPTIKGLKTGEFKKFYPNGEVKSLTSYSNGKKNGNAFKWKPSGEVIRHEIYANDSLIDVIHH